ncbi:MAG: aminotransferase, partial [Rhodobacterales bacterium CG15_BIG_FIL_POST_REV_8_21_14_020_59_13]
ARRYFYPLIPDFPMYRGLPSSNLNNLPVATNVAKHVLCLPIYPALGEEDQARIIHLIIETAHE